jgi:Tfp pilus assembly protein PilZ
MIEKRQHERISLPLEVHLESLSGKYAARLTDLSLGGCYIETLALVSVGERVRFEVHLPTARRLLLKGEVIYHQPTLGFGVCFVDLSDVDREMLAQIVEYGKHG